MKNALLTLLFLVLCLHTAEGSEAKTQSMIEEMLLPAVSITTVSASEVASFGSGFFILPPSNEEGVCTRYVLTNFHVVGSAFEEREQTGVIFVNIPSFMDGIFTGSTTVPAAPIALHPSFDIALLGFRTSCNKEFHEVKVESGTKVAVFQHVWIVSAFGGDVKVIAVEEGNVSRRFIDGDGLEYFSISNLVSRGQSGGAVLVLGGDSSQFILAGMIKSSAEEDFRNNRVIPVNRISLLLEPNVSD